MTRPRWLALALAICALTTACTGVSDLRADQLRVVAPSELATVQLPVTVQWRTHELPGSVTQYAVFVDRLPMSPGDDVRSLVDDECRHRRGCPDAAYLHARRIFLTSEQQISLPTLQNLDGLSAETPFPVHQAVVVALDAQGRRVGEFSATARFRFER